MKQNTIVVLMFALVITACSIFDNDEGVVLSTSSDKLIIENNFNVRIYYNVIDYTDVPLHDWAQFKDDKISIKAGDSKKIKFEDIFTTKERSLRNGDKVEVSWWNDEFIDEMHTFGYDGVGESNGVERITL